MMDVVSRVMPQVLILLVVGRESEMAGEVSHFKPSLMIESREQLTSNEKVPIYLMLEAKSCNVPCVFFFNNVDVLTNN